MDAPPSSDSSASRHLEVTRQDWQAAGRDPRVLFAAERTFLAWLRTGLALMGFGFVVARFGLFLQEVAAVRGEPHPAGMSRGFGIALVALGIALTVGAVAEHVAIMRRLDRGEPFRGRPTRLGIAIGVLLVIVGGLMAAYLVTAV